MTPSFYQALPDPTPLVGAKTPYALAFFYHAEISDISEYFYQFRDTIVIVYNTDTIFKGGSALGRIIHPFVTFKPSISSEAFTDENFFCNVSFEYFMNLRSLLTTEQELTIFSSRSPKLTTK